MQTENATGFDWLNEGDEKRAGETCFAAARWIDEQQTARVERLAMQARMYGGIAPEAFRGYVPSNSLALGTLSPATGGAPPQLSMNACRSVTDTAVSRVTGLDVRPLFQTKNGDWAMQQQAKGLETFVDGQFRTHKMRQHGPEAFRDACTYDFGATHVFAHRNKIKQERVWPLELLVDTAEGRYRTPRTMYRKKWVARSTLMKRYPKHEDLIRSAGRGDTWWDSEAVETMRVADMALVVEAWWLPTDDGLPGRHVVALAGGALLCEEWSRDRFPIAICRYSTRPLGFNGQGIVENIRGNQRQMNHTLRTMQEIIQKGTVPSVWLQAGNTGARAQLTNEIMAIRTYTGNPPVFSQGVEPGAALMDLVLLLWNKSFEQEGVSQLDASSVKPGGLDSGEAIRVYRDSGAQRFITATKNYEEYCLEVAELHVEAGRQIAKKHPDFEVLVPGKRYSQMLRFKDIDLEREKYVLQLFPTSALPADPSGRLAQISDYLKAGLLDAMQGKRLLQFPDLDEVISLETAPVEDILATISDLLQGKAYRPPEPYQDMNLGIKYFQWSRAKARRDGAPQDILDNLDLWMVQADDQLKLQESAASPAAAPGMPPSVGIVPPTASPTAAPTSAIVPNAPAQAA